MNALWEGDANRAQWHYSIALLKDKAEVPSNFFTWNIMLPLLWHICDMTCSVHMLLMATMANFFTSDVYKAFALI